MELNESGLISVLYPDQLARLREEAETNTKEYAVGDLIFSHHGYLKALGIILGGRVSVWRTGDQTVLINQLVEGDMFGMAGLFLPESTAEKGFVTEIRAEKETTVTFISAETVMDFIRTNPDFAEKYVYCLTGRIRFLNARIIDFTANDSEKRLAGYLAGITRTGCGEGDGGHLIRLNRSALAKTLDLGRASLYRAFERLEEKKLIKNTREGIIIIDRVGLAACAVPVRSAGSARKG